MATFGSAKHRWQFTEEEIRAKLDELGYNNIPDKALKEFSDGMKTKGGSVFYVRLVNKFSLI